MKGNNSIKCAVLSRLLMQEITRREYKRKNFLDKSPSNRTSLGKVRAQPERVRAHP
jgi:hypothetical protein